MDSIASALGLGGLGFAVAVLVLVGTLAVLIAAFRPNRQYLGVERGRRPEPGAALKPTRAAGGEPPVRFEKPDMSPAEAGYVYRDCDGVEMVLSTIVDLAARRFLDIIEYQELAIPRPTVIIVTRRTADGTCTRQEKALLDLLAVPGAAEAPDFIRARPFNPVHFRAQLRMAGVSRLGSPSARVAGMRRSVAELFGRDVAKAAADSYEARARRETAWPPARLVRRASDPLVRLGLVSAPNRKRRPSAGNLAAGSSAAARSRVREYVDERLDCLPGTWRVEVAEKSDERATKLIESADSLMSAVDLEYRHKPSWWAAVNVFQILFFLVFLVGALWLVPLAAIGLLRDGALGSPHVGPLPLPLCLVAGGLAAGWLLSFVSGSSRARAAEQVRIRVEGRLVDAVDRGARESILDPVETERSRYVSVMDSIGKLASVG